MRGTLTIASFWGEDSDWPFVRAPNSWENVASAYNSGFEIAKFPTQGTLAAVRQLRLTQSGGLASSMVNWLTNALLQARLGSNVSVTAAMRPMPYQLDIGETTRDLADKEDTYSESIELEIRPN